MSELELALVHLGRQLEFPPTPELSARVERRLASDTGQSEPRPYGRRRILAIALAVLAVAVGAVLAVPQTRAAILEFFHLRGVTIQRVDELPTVPTRSSLGLGSPVALDEVEVGWEVVVPAALGEPDTLYYRPDPPGGMVSLLYGSPEEPRAIVTQFRGTVREAIFKKVLAGTRIDEVSIDGGAGFWLSGEPHLFYYFAADGQFREERVRLAGNVLLWERGELTLRLEADVTKADALKIARSVP